MSSSIKEALEKANINATNLKRRPKKHSVPFYLKPPFTMIGREYLYDDTKHGYWNMAEDQPKDNKNVQLMLASNTNRLFLLPKNLCQAYCNIWIGYNRKFDRYTIRGDPCFKLRNFPEYVLKHAQIRRLMDNYKISLDFSLLDIIRVLNRKGMEQLIMALYADNTNPIIVEIDDL